MWSQTWKFRNDVDFTKFCHPLCEVKCENSGLTLISRNFVTLYMKSNVKIEEWRWFHEILPPSTWSQMWKFRIDVDFTKFCHPLCEVKCENSGLTLISRNFVTLYMKSNVKIEEWRWFHEILPPSTWSQMWKFRIDVDFTKFCHPMWSQTWK